MKIPRIIHQTWKEYNIPAPFDRLAESWKNNHSDWKYILWTDEMNHTFISTHFPEFLEKYDAYPHDIQRVDAVRYLVLYQMGGVFVDLDFESLENISPILGAHQCVLGREPEEHCRIHKKDIIISNAFMAAVPGLSFFKALYEELINYNAVIGHQHDWVLESTGPFMLTRVYKNYENKNEITILSPDLIYPLTKTEIGQLRINHEPADHIQQKIDGAYAVHYYSGSWWRKG